MMTHRILLLDQKGNAVAELTNQKMVDEIAGTSIIFWGEDQDYYIYNYQLRNGEYDFFQKAPGHILQVSTDDLEIRGG